MEYEPLKHFLNNLIKKSRIFRKCFYFGLDALILRQWYVKKYIRNYIRHCESVVFYDAGAGFCQYSDFVLAKNKQIKVYAVDINGDFISDYQRSLRDDDKKRFVSEMGDLTSFILPEEAGLVIAIDILEHIEDDVAVLQSFYESMSGGGVLIIHTPTDRDTSAGFTAEHIRAGYAVSDLCDKLTEAGFSVLSTEYTYGFWGQIYWKLVMRNGLWLVHGSWFFKCVLPVYLLVVLVPSLVCMVLDFVLVNKDGNGVVVVGKL